MSRTTASAAAPAISIVSEFDPETGCISVAVGETTIVHYRVECDEPLTVDTVEFAEFNLVGVELVTPCGSMHFSGPNLLSPRFADLFYRLSDAAWERAYASVRSALKAAA